MYTVRMKSEVWNSAYDFEMVQHQEGLVDISFYEFAKTFYVRNKKTSEKVYYLKKHIKNNKVIIFTPVLSTDPADENYNEFCRLNLIKY